MARALARRQGKLRRGYYRHEARLPRGLWALFEARDGSNRKLLYAQALMLYLAYSREAQEPNEEGRRRVAGKTRAYYARCLGCSIRHIRRCDAQLRAVGLVMLGGYYVHTGPDGKPTDGRIGRIEKRRRVTWLPPLQEVALVRFVEALADTDSGPPCPPDLEEASKEASSGDLSLLHGPVIGSDAAASPPEVFADGVTDEPPPARAATAERPTAAPRGGRATSGPSAPAPVAGILDGELFYTRLRRYEGAELRALILEDLERHGAETDLRTRSGSRRSAPATSRRTNPADGAENATTGRPLRPVHALGTCRGCPACYERAGGRAAFAKSLAVLLEARDRARLPQRE